MKNKKVNPLYADFVRLLELEKIEPADVQHLSPDQLHEFKGLVKLKLTTVTGTKHEREVARYQRILEPEKSTALTPALPENHEFDYLFELDRIDRSHTQNFTPEQKKRFREVLESKLNNTTGEALDALCEKIAVFLDDEKIWEINHQKINNAVRTFVNKYGTMPTKSHLVKETGLSKPTVYKHIQAIKTSPIITEQNELFGLMTKQVLGKLLQTALRGDVAAAKLYLNTVSKQYPGTGNDVVINTQNNIQINRTVLNQQTIEQLNPEQLQQIEEIIKRSLEKRNN